MRGAMAVIARAARTPAVAAALIVGVVLGAPLLLGARFMGLDHTRNLLPTLCAHDGIDGEGALLDRALGGGSPLLEDPLGLVFSPIARALAFLPAEDRASAFTWLWLVAAAAAVAWLGRGFGMSRRAQLALGVAWPLCGTALDLVMHGPYVVDAALVPLAWAGLRGLRRRSTLRARDACAVACAMALLAVHGGLQACLWMGLLGIVELGALAATRRARARTKALARVGALIAALGAGSLLAGLQILPTLGLGAAAARASGVDSTAAWSLAAPEVFGVPWPLVATARSAVGASLVTAWDGSVATRAEWNASPFLGLVALAGALVVLRARRARPLVALGALTAAMAAGTATPIYGVLLTLAPPLQLFRYPARYFVLTSLAVLVLAALALDGAARSRRLRARLAVVLGALSAASGVAVLVVLARRGAIDAAERLVATRAPFAGEPSLAGMLVAAGTTTTFFSLMVAALLARASTDAHGARRAPLTVVALPLSLLLAVPAIASYGAPLFDPAREPPLATPARALAAADAPDEPPTQLCIGRAVKALHVDRADRALAAEGDLLVDLADHKPDLSRCGGPATPHIGLPSSQRESILLAAAVDEEHGVLAPARALGCTHVVTRGAIDDPALAHVPIDAPPFTARFYAIDDALPDASIARAPRLVASEATRLLQEVVRAPDSAALAAIVDDPRGTLDGRALPDGARAGAVHASFPRPDTGSVRVDGDGGAVVVLRRAWWPGFSATQAGRALPVVRVAGAQLGLVVFDVRAGPIDVVYRARGLGAGVASALAGALALAALCFGLARLRRRA